MSAKLTDTARLDWLTKDGFKLVRDAPHDGWLVVKRARATRKRIPGIWWGLTVREAIDAAIKAERTRKPRRNP